MCVSFSCYWREELPLMLDTQIICNIFSLFLPSAASSSFVLSLPTISADKYGQYQWIDMPMRESLPQFRLITRDTKSSCVFSALAGWLAGWLNPLHKHLMDLEEVSCILFALASENYR